MTASEDAQKLVNQEKSFACAELESARAAAQRIGEALEEQERNQSSGKQQELEELIEEVPEGRRIKFFFLLQQNGKKNKVDASADTERATSSERATSPEPISPPASNGKNGQAGPTYLGERLSTDGVTILHISLMAS
ncbi:hypothetical protein OROGR_016906 [Orobanche gracilis]